MDRCLLIISCGEISGIGYELALKVKKITENKSFFLLVLIGNLTWLKYVSKKINLDFSPIVIDEEILLATKNFSIPKNKYLLIDIPSNYCISELKKKSGEISIRTLKKVVEVVCKLLKSNINFCVLTMPVSKKYIQKYDKNFVGHTEFFAKKFNVLPHQVSMLMEGMDNRKNLYKVLMLTRHVSLKDVVKNLDIEKSVSQIKNVVSFIDKYEKIKLNRIIICGVNPHNGDNGVIGDEEKTLLLKIVKKLKNLLPTKKILFPYAVADAFNFVKNKQDSLIVCSYHDQAMIPLKLLCGYRIVNITVGLPFLRVSPGHGTAEDIMLKNKADISGVKFCVKKLQEFFTNANPRN
jgi:4-hydroxythreonine-4-phosphate dehydrogenase